ncbi:MAG: TetR family transcriptional regulator C-terminal domain-containing protein [Planctomycetota bacterium]
MATLTPTPTRDTRDRIIAAGTQVITEKGYHGCGLSEILRAAEVPKGSFYHYFKSKEDFGVAVIEDFVAHYGLKLSKKLTDRRLPALERLRRHYLDAVGWYEEHGYESTCLVAKLGMDVASMSRDMQAAMKAGMDQWTSILAKCLREAQAAGELDASWDADPLAAFLMNAWEGAAVQTQIARNTDAIHNFVETVFDRILA